ncbi:MAG: Peptidyl-tRNA hydrolase, partial [uncultured bacterium]
MKLIIGLGNPGKQYENTRHNAGFIVLDEITGSFSFPEFESNKKFNAQISEGTIGNEKIILAKPETFMNLSGKSVQAIMQFFKIPIENLIVIHDDLDIELGAFKISTDSSAAGHNGVTSIFETLGTQKITRIRVGIEGAEKKKDRIIPGDVFVLQPFSTEEL